MSIPSTKLKPISDADREREIEYWFDEMKRIGKEIHAMRGEQRMACKHMTDLINGRSPEQVEKMNQEQGIV